MIPPERTPAHPPWTLTRHIGLLSLWRTLQRRPHPAEGPQPSDKAVGNETEVLRAIVKRELSLANITFQWPLHEGIMASQATRFTRPPPEFSPGVYIITHPGSPVRAPVDTGRATVVQQPDESFQIGFPLAETGITLTLSGLADVVPRVRVLHENEPVSPKDALIIKRGEQLGNLGKGILGLHMTYRPHGLTITEEPQAVDTETIFGLFPSLTQNP